MTLLGTATDIVEFQHFPTFYRKLINFKDMHGGVIPQDTADPQDIKNIKSGMHIKGMSFSCTIVQQKTYTYTLLEVEDFPLDKFKTRWRQLHLHITLGHFIQTETMHPKTETMYPGHQNVTIYVPNSNVIKQITCQ